MHVSGLDDNLIITRAVQSFFALDIPTALVVYV